MKLNGLGATRRATCTQRRRQVQTASWHPCYCRRMATGASEPAQSRPERAGRRMRSGNSRRCAWLRRSANRARSRGIGSGGEESGATVGNPRAIDCRGRQREVAGVVQAERAVLEYLVVMLPFPGVRQGDRCALRAGNSADFTPRHRVLRRRQRSRQTRRERRQQDRENRDPGGEAGRAAGERHRNSGGRISAWSGPCHPCCRRWSAA